MDNDQRKIFWETLCSFTGENPQEESLKLMEQIKYPKYLCRYRTINSRNLEALRSNKMYFISADNYDDPFDTFITYDLKKINALINNVDTSKIELFEQYNDILKLHNIELGLKNDDLKCIKSVPRKKIIERMDYELKNNIKDIIQKQQYSICFSEDCINETLWLKYADNHQGFCLIYDLENEENFKCEKEVHNCCPSNISTPIYPIYYSDEKYDATKYALAIGVYDYLKKFNDGVKTSEFMSEILPMRWERERISLIKHKYHEYDKEWRMILPFNPGKPLSKRWIPDSIIIGLKTSNEDKILLIRAAKHAGIKNIYESYIDENFNLNAFKYTDEDIERLLS